MKKISIFVCVVLLATAPIFSQTILTASAFFQSVSEYYGTITDYEADVKITAGSTKMEGKVSFKRPNLLRIDFTNPDSQVIVYNGDQLTIYLPGSDAVLTQTSATSGDTATSGANLATPQGLYLMSRYYYISYEVGQSPVPLNDNSDEMVVKLILSRKNASEGFKTIRIAISPDTKLIRQVEALTIANETFIFSFDNYILNQNIPAARFIYDSPSSANKYNNFLFTE